MQSMLALVGLALANFAAAGPCKPSSPTTVNSLSLTVRTTDISKSSVVPSSSIPESATTTEEPQGVITNTFVDGGFANGLDGVNTEGQVDFHSGGCFKKDGSKDDGCAALSATGNPAGKRDLGSFASLFQTLNSLNTGRRNKYTVQFYYLIFTAGSQACTVSATFGNRQFYSQSLLNFGGINMQWNHVLEQVEADSSSANFAISMTCTGQGISMILVDSVFISNQVTPDNIGDFKLDLGGPTANTDPTTTSQPTLASTTGAGGVEESNTSAHASSNTEEATTHTEKPNSASQAATETASIGSQTSSPETTHSAQEISSTSAPETTAPPQQISSTSPPGTTTSPSETTKTSCKATCETIDNPREHTDDWNCSVYGLYRGSAQIIPAPNQDLDDENRVFYRNPGDCAAICRTMPGCKSAGYMFASAQCFFSTSVIPQSEVRDASNDAVDVDWYGIDKCFTCSGCESGSVETSAPAVASTSKAPEQATTTKSAEPTQTACLPTCAQKDDWNMHDEWNCHVYGSYDGDFYDLSGQGTWNGEPEQCMELCKATPGCKSAAVSYFWLKCYGSSNVVTREEIRDASDDSTDKEWWSPQCFNCDDSKCESGSSGETTTQAPERTTFTTRTSAPATTTTAPADTCIYNRGQYCEFNRFKDHSDTVCVWAGTYPGNTWTETREDYPYQDDPYQCIAICQTLKNCESAGYYSTENRCLFTSKKLKTSDMVPGAHDFDNSVWLHNSCVTCPTCSNSAPLPQTDKCSYKQGDTCTRKRGNDGALCNYQGMWEWYNQQSLDRYPDQSSPEKCMAICQATEYCKGSGYKDGRCMFSFGELKTGSFRDWPDHSRDGTWDDPSCFECPGCTE
ncbi:hypothetical protein F53441_10729 [Fusarium austroafricanum]|uniref:Apple domain-containing protein n=1 Tax=Fusarium austroafricanum TaxID=2364996 RepID=A0A8H4P1X1_9HYPO|nr:hypothetical protein F53441_10729 [Fusarium austroafricanum]